MLGPEVKINTRLSVSVFMHFRGLTRGKKLWEDEVQKEICTQWCTGIDDRLYPWPPAPLVTQSIYTAI